MDPFDDEPTPGGTYQHSFDRPIFDVDGISRRIVSRFTKLRGRFVRISITLEERRAGHEGQLIRFDDAHRRFHRHVPGWPEPGAIDVYLDGVEPHVRIEFALREIVLRYTDYEAAVFGKDPR
jgi:hypothetical protein